MSAPPPPPDIRLKLNSNHSLDAFQSKTIANITFSDSFPRFPSCCKWVGLHENNEKKSKPLTLCMFTCVPPRVPDIQNYEWRTGTRSTSSCFPGEIFHFSPSFLSLPPLQTYAARKTRLARERRDCTAVEKLEWSCLWRCSDREFSNDGKKQQHTPVQDTAGTFGRGRRSHIFQNVLFLPPPRSLRVPPTMQPRAYAMLHAWPYRDWYRNREHVQEI